MVPLLAITSAFFYSLLAVLTALGLRYVNVLSAVIIVQLASVVAALAISFVTVPFYLYADRGIVYFLAAGVLGPFIAHYFLVEGIDRVGSSIATAIMQTRPLYSALGAVILLSESLTSVILLGMVLMIIGTGAISLEQSGGKIVKQWSRKDLLFPFVAGASWGFAHVVRKMGLNAIPDPIVGVTVQNATALALFSFVAVMQGRKHPSGLANRSAWVILSVAGISSVVAQLFLFYALDLGEVVIVSPLASLNTFFVLILAGTFLKKLEKITWKIVLGAVFIVAGAVTLTVTSHT